MMKKQLFGLTWLFAALLLLVACKETEDADKTAETLKKLTGNWLYTSETDMKCYLLTFYESSEFLYQSQEVNVKKVLAGNFVYSEDFNTITLMPTTGESPITFQLGNVDTIGEQLSLVTAGGQALSFSKTPLTQLPAHDNWKPWEPLNVNDKEYLEETAKEFMALFQVNDFKNLVEIARGVKEYDTSYLYAWQKECIESMRTLVAERMEDDHYILDSNFDFYIRSSVTFYTDYRRLLRVSAFTGHFSVQGGKWVYSKANDLQFTFNDRQGQQCVLKISSSGATKTVFAGKENGYNDMGHSYWDDEYGNSHYDDGTEYSTTNNYIEIPEHLTLTLTQGGKNIISTTADFDLSGIGGEQWDLAKNGLSSVVKANVNGYELEAERIAYSPSQGAQAILQLKKDNNTIITVNIEGTGYADITSEHGLRDFNTSTLGTAKATVDILGKIQFYANISDIHAMRRAIDNANNNRGNEREFKRYVENANKQFTAFFCYANEGEEYVRGTLALEAFASSDWDGERWEARPVITFRKDNSSYAIDSYFTEDRFRTVTNAFWNLLDDFEDLANTVGSGASWGENTYLRVNGFVMFTKSGGEKKVDISCEGQWTMTDIPSWVRASSTSGKDDVTITISVDSYYGSEMRKGTMYVKSGNVKRAITVVQLSSDIGITYDDPATEIEGCYKNYSWDNKNFFVMTRLSNSMVRLTYPETPSKYVDFTLTQTPEGIIYMKGNNVEGNYFVEDGRGRLYLVDNTGGGVFMGKVEGSKGSGSLDNPFNAVAASAYAEYIGRNSESPTDVYIKGKVASIVENYDNSYGNATFHISDDGSSTNTFYIYRAYYLGNSKYTDGNLLKEGDDVVIYGKVTYYNGSIPETVTKKAFLYSLNGVIPKKIWIYGGKPEMEPPFSPGAWDAAAMRFSSTEGAHFPTIPDNVYFGLKTLILDVSNASDDCDMKVMNGWWSNTYYDHVKIVSGLNEIKITEEMARECAKGGEGKDLDLMLYSGTMTLNSVYYEEY